MPLLRICGDAPQRALDVVVPIRRKQATESRDKDDAPVVLDGAGQLTDLGGVAEEAEVVHEKLDAGAGHGDGALERVHGLDALRGEVEGDGGQQAVLGDDGLFTHVVQQETARAVGVFGAARREPALPDQRGRLVAQTARDAHALQFGAGELAVRRVVARGDDLGEVQLRRLDVELEERDQLVVVRQVVDVHEHGARRVRRVRHKHVALRPAVQLVYQPAVDGAERERARVVRLLDFVHVAQEPQQFRAGRVCGQGQAAEVREAVGAVARLEVVHDARRARVGPHDRVVQWLARLDVPHTRRLALVRDPHRFDLRDRVPLRLELFDCLVDAFRHRRHELQWVVFVPSVEKDECVNIVR